jgi:hypothetical protein
LTTFGGARLHEPAETRINGRNFSMASTLKYALTGSDRQVRSELRTASRWGLLAGCLLFGGFVACASPNSGEDAGAVQLCEEPRPQICTRDYRPVCAQSGARPSRTASNGCTACSNADVTGYVEGACASD